MSTNFVQEYSVIKLLNQVSQYYSIADIATEFQVNQSTIHRWLNGTTEAKAFIADRLVNMLTRKISAKKMMKDKVNLLLLTYLQE